MNELLFVKDVQLPIVEYRVFFYILLMGSRKCDAFWLAQKGSIFCHVVAYHYIHKGDSDLEWWSIDHFIFDCIEEFLNHNKIWFRV